LPYVDEYTPTLNSDSLTEESGTDRIRELPRRLGRTNKSRGYMKAPSYNVLKGVKPRETIRFCEEEFLVQSEVELSRPLKTDELLNSDYASLANLALAAYNRGESVRSLDTLLWYIKKSNLKSRIKIHFYWFVQRLWAWAHHTNYPERWFDVINQFCEYKEKYAGILKDYRQAMETLSGGEVSPNPNDYVDLGIVSEWNDYDDLPSEDVLPNIWIDESDEAFNYIYEPVIRDESSLADFRLATKMYLAKFMPDRLYVPTEEDYRLRRDNTMMFDPLLGKNRLAKQVLGEYKDLSSLINKDFRYNSVIVPVGPGNYRYPWVCNANAYLSHYKYETVVSQILDLDPRSFYTKNFDIKKMPKYGKYKAWTDFKKAGLTFPLQLLDIIAEEIDIIFPELKMKQYADAHRASAITHKRKDYGILDRGFGLGNMNAIMTLAVCIVSRMIEKRGVFFNDDTLWFIEEEMEYYQILETLEGLGFLLSYSKSSYSRDRYKFLEQYYPYQEKNGYMAAHLMDSLHGWNKTHVRFKLESLCDSPDCSREVRDFLLCCYKKLYDFELYGQEFEFPRECGGWLNMNKGGFNYFFRWLETQAEEYGPHHYWRDLPDKPERGWLKEPVYDWESTSAAYCLHWRVERYVNSILSFYAPKNYDTRKYEMAFYKSYNSKMVRTDRAVWDALRRKRLKLFKKASDKYSKKPYVLSWNHLLGKWINWLDGTSYYALPRGLFMEQQPWKAKEIGHAVKFTDMSAPNRCWTRENANDILRELLTSNFETDLYVSLVSRFQPAGISSDKMLRIVESKEQYLDVLLKFGWVPELLLIEYATNIKNPSGPIVIPGLGIKECRSDLVNDKARWVRPPPEPIRVDRPVEEPEEETPILLFDFSLEELLEKQDISSEEYYENRILDDDFDDDIEVDYDNPDLFI
jgi:hypothetical protein